MIHIDPQDLVVTPWPALPTRGMLTGDLPKGVSILHKPTGMRVSCNVDRCQHRNKERALAMLREIIEGRELARERARQKLAESVTP